MKSRRETKRKLRLSTLSLCLFTAAGVAEPPPLLRPGANPDPLRLASLPFDVGDAMDVGTGQWRLTTSLNYVNLWNYTWHTVAYHREVGRVGLALSSDELAGLAARYPDEHYQFLDVEGWWSQLWVQRGLGRGVTVTLQIPYLEIGRPHWDAVAEKWHEKLGLPDFDRDEFPRGQTLVYIKGPAGTVERRDLAGSGVGDIALSVAVPAGRWLGARHRAVFALEAPTGQRDTLHGSGGWDAGVRLVSWWEGNRISALSGLGYTWPSLSGDLLGLKRSHVWHTMAGVDWRLWRALLVTVRLQVERALLAEAAGDRLAKVTLSKRFGMAAPISPGMWLAFDLGQDSLRNGIAPDYSFHLTVGTHLR